MNMKNSFSGIMMVLLWEICVLEHVKSTLDYSYSSEGLPDNGLDSRYSYSQLVSMEWNM